MKQFVSILVATMILPLVPASAQKTAGASDGMTLSSYQERERNRIMVLDTNHDGKVSQAEWAADSKRQPKNFTSMDANGDGQLDNAEIDARQAKRFAKLDADGDGTVTRAEQKAAKAAN